MRGGRILTSKPSPEDILLRLASGLHTLLKVAEKGEWEKLDGLHGDLLQTMDILCAPPPHDLSNAERAAQVKGVLQLLDDAMAACSERKDQIAGLVNAFSKATTPPPQP